MRAALILALLVVASHSLAADGGTITVLHPTPGVGIEAEIEGIGSVPFVSVAEGVVGGTWWTVMRPETPQDVPYAVRVRATMDDRVPSEWTPWSDVVGSGVDTCLGPEDDGAIGLDDLGWVLSKLNQPGRVCVR